MDKDKLCEIIESHGKWLRGKPGGERADLSDAKLRYADLRYANLSNANLRGADLRYANLRYANLSDANLRYANLSNANLRVANLRGANLSDADLTNAILAEADLRDADLTNAILTKANLSGATTDKRYIQVACVGSRKGTTTYCFDDDIVICGCWNDYEGGTLDEFEVRVKEVHADNPQYLKEYLGFIAYVRSLRGDK